MEQGTILLRQLNAEWKAFLYENRMEYLFKYSAENLKFVNGIEIAKFKGKGYEFTVTFVELDGLEYNFSMVYDIFKGTWIFGEYDLKSGKFINFAESHYFTKKHFTLLFRLFGISKIDIVSYAKLICENVDHD